LPVVITTSDDFSREEAVEYVERILSNLEETDEVYRTYVEASGIDEGEAERMLDMLKAMDEDSLSDALDAIDHVTEDEK
jgi:maltooligosyltrehalose synthase